MSRGYVWSMSNSAALGTRKKVATSEFKVGPNALKFLLVLIVFFSGLFYIGQAANNSNQVREISVLNEKLATLKKEGEGLEADKSKHEALSQVEESKDGFGLIPTQKVDFVLTPGGGFAGL